MNDDAAFDLNCVVAGCLVGDEPAISTLIRRYHRLVFSLCLRMLGQRQDAEDATQETFVRVVKNIGQWDSNRRFEPWLLTVAGNRCRTKMAKRATQAKTQLLNEDLDVKVQPDLETPALILEEVHAALELLRPEYQQVFSLFHFQHRSFEEIAMEMRVPYATVKTWCHRARKEMAEILERRGNLTEELGAVPSGV